MNYSYYSCFHLCPRKRNLADPYLEKVLFIPAALNMRMEVGNNKEKEKEKRN